MPTLDEEERREYYRIEDSVALEIQRIPGPGSGDEYAHDDTSTLFDLLSELHVAEFESQHLLRQLDDRDRTTNSFLRAMSKRIDLLGQVVAQTVLGKLGAPQKVIMSEGGLQFESHQPFPAGTLLSVKMVLMPQASGMMLRARVTQCQSHTIGDFEIGTEWVDLTDAQRQLLARHILQRQAAQRRQAREQGNPAPH
ncbi:PilZ domain-containing protein [Pseudomonas sp. GD03842]|uniref:PilZ domain-containing protein n=1 Tax=Pseudomonas sp. GD03842 TaxID=2975385 RepID=UPI002449A022|nr:PilZ domain-containing protein [Pseudomonas sp. GD03842]MDH0749735.1 PilZ domain-containing protein [Pseudomonas sp. GD03842]